MILTPSRKLWTPWDDAKRKWQRFLTKFQEGKLQRDPTTGKLKRNSDGKLIRNSSSSSACCCDAIYSQAERCSDRVAVDLWKLGDYTVLSPYYFSLAGTCYVIDEDCNTSATPGTILTGETTQTGCVDCNSSHCCERGIPTSVTVSVTGLSAAADCCTPYENVGGAVPTITFDITSTRSGCSYSGQSSPVTGPAVKQWDSGGCSGSVLNTYTDYYLVVNFSLSTGAYSVQVNVDDSGTFPSGIVVFSASGTQTGCPESFNDSNDESSVVCDPSGLIFGNGSGTVTFTLSWA